MDYVHPYGGLKDQCPNHCWSQSVCYLLELLAEKRGKASIYMRVLKDNEKAKKERREAEKSRVLFIQPWYELQLSQWPNKPTSPEGSKIQVLFLHLHMRHSRALPGKVPQSPYPMHAWIAFPLCPSSKYDHVLMALCLSSSFLGNWNMTSAENLEKKMIEWLIWSGDLQKQKLHYFLVFLGSSCSKIIHWNLV